MRPGEPACAHAVASLPVGMGRDGWRNLIEGFCEDHLAHQGMICDWAIHARPAVEGKLELLPRAHLLVTARVFDRASADLGRVRQAWMRTEQARKTMAERWWARSGLYPRSYAMAA